MGLLWSKEELGVVIIKRFEVRSMRAEKFVLSQVVGQIRCILRPRLISFTKQKPGEAA